jgi:hypothetical protein
MKRTPIDGVPRSRLTVCRQASCFEDFLKAADGVLITVPERAFLLHFGPPDPVRNVGEIGHQAARKSSWRVENEKRKRLTVRNASAISVVHRAGR